MPTRMAQVVADSILELSAADPELKVGIQEPIVPIDPISMRPNYEQAELPKMLITTEVPSETVMGTFVANEAAVDAAIGRSN